MIVTGEHLDSFAASKTERQNSSALAGLFHRVHRLDVQHRQTVDPSDHLFTCPEGLEYADRTYGILIAFSFLESVDREADRRSKTEKYTYDEYGTPLNGPSDAEMLESLRGLVADEAVADYLSRSLFERFHFSEERDQASFHDGTMAFFRRYGCLEETVS